MAYVYIYEKAIYRLVVSTMNFLWSLKSHHIKNETGDESIHLWTVKNGSNNFFVVLKNRFPFYITGNEKTTRSFGRINDSYVLSCTWVKCTHHYVGEIYSTDTRRKKGLAFYLFLSHGQSFTIYLFYFIVVIYFLFIFFFDRSQRYKLSRTIHYRYFVTWQGQFLTRLQRIVPTFSLRLSCFCVSSRVHTLLIWDTHHTLLMPYVYQYPVLQVIIRIGIRILIETRINIIEFG